ncbi:MAG: hypothetical protein IJA11_01505 [Oscillospiraceae bacterium]|nr:hypothetical protein [Oscillospiraceae bacterium]
MSGGFEEKLNAILGDKNAMGQIMALAQSLSGSEQQGGPAGAEQPEFVPVEECAGNEEPPIDFGTLLNSVDPAVLQLGMRLMQEYNRSDDDAAALLCALRPFVKPERYARLDKAARAARLSRVVRVLLDTFRQSRGAGDV